MAISSTDIKRRVKENKTIKYLLPESVEAYIWKEGLYFDN
jgi:nicotinate-nucleotide adenylyltransferase